MEGLKKNSNNIAGLIFLIFAVVGFITKSGALNIIYNVALLVVAVLCFGGKGKPVQAALFGVMAVITILSNIRYIFYSLGDWFENIFGGFFGLIPLVDFPLSLVSTILTVVSLVTMAVLIVTSSTNKESALGKWWFAPAALYFIGELLGCLWLVFWFLVYPYYGILETLINIVKTVAIALIFSAGLAMAALAAKQQKDIEPTNEV